MSTRIITTLAKLAVAPFKTTAVKSDTSRPGLAFVANKTELTELEVVFDGQDLAAGSKVWVYGDTCKHEWAKQVFELDDKKFILLPKDLILMYERKAA